MKVRGKSVVSGESVTEVRSVAMGKRTTEQVPMWAVAADLPLCPAIRSPLCLTRAAPLDCFAEDQVSAVLCAGDGATESAAGSLLRLLPVGYFESLDSDRGIAWSAADSLAVRRFVRAAARHRGSGSLQNFADAPLINAETHRAILSGRRSAR